jgi:phosphomannomutase/phosphoglucomutase
VGDNTQFPGSVFKAYDIRGTVPDLIDARFARALGVALAARARDQGVQTLVVGRDGRLSSEMLSIALQEGMLEGGVDTLDIGMVPTPLVYFAANVMQTGSGVAITGSHNPPKYNGFKMMMGGRALYGEDVQALAASMNGPASAPAARPGVRRQLDLVASYIARVASGIKLARPMKIAIDCGNGVAGAVAPALFRALGCEVTELFCEVDGTFPNHHPDPAEPKNLQDLIKCVAETDCELVLFARDVLERNPGATIIYDVKCSRHVGLSVEAAGGVPLMWKTGHSLVKAKLAETGAPLAGEMSGHIFFKERWYGFDDGLYTGARLLEIVSRDADPCAVLEALPQDVSTPELKLEMEEGQPFTLVQALQDQGQFPDANRVITIDGVRAEYPDGFGLARPSNTTPVVVLRFEAQTTAALERIQADFRRELSKLAPQAKLPF